METNSTLNVPKGLKVRIKNRNFKISLHQLFRKQDEVVSLIILRFWLVWKLKSFQVTLLNVQFETWNPTNNYF